MVVAAVALLLLLLHCRCSAAAAAAALPLCVALLWHHAVPLGRARMCKRQEYGFDDTTGVQFFNGDNFNEMEPRSREPAYLASWGDAM